MNQSFNPEQHLMDLGGKSYLEVKWRLAWYRQECPTGTIDTEEILVDLDREVEKEVLVWDDEKRKKVKVMKKAQGYARYKAIVTDGKGGRATGTKTETAIDFPDFCEKAETGAIGRALAGLGYGTQFVGEEFDEGERIVDAPVQRKSVEASRRDSDGAAVQTSHHSQQNGTAMPATQPQVTITPEREEMIQKFYTRGVRVQAFAPDKSGATFRAYLTTLLEREVKHTKTLSDDELSRIDLDLASREQPAA